MDNQEAQQIKEQLLKQLESMNLENKEEIKESVKAMNSQQLEQFLKQNNIQYKTTDKKPVGKSNQECIFCAILERKMPAYILDENKKALAILEINPLSKAHSLIISKQHSKLNSSALGLANKIAKRIKKKLKPEQVKIQTDKILGHELVQVIPVYKNQKLEAKKADEKSLILLQDKLKKQTRRKSAAKTKTIKEKPIIKIPKAPIRIP